MFSFSEMCKIAASLNTILFYENKRILSPNKLRKPHTTSAKITTQFTNNLLNRLVAIGTD